MAVEVEVEGQGRGSTIIIRTKGYAGQGMDQQESITGATTKIN